MYSIFFVEDEIVIREGIKQFVAWEEYGFTLIGEAPDGELAWPLIQKQKPDIVITDIKMPFMDGLELSKLIKKELPRTVVIILSGHDDFTYAREALNIGVNQYLLKPLSKNQLTDVLLDVKKKKDEEAEEEQYKLQLVNEMREYLSSYRRGFFDELVSGGFSIPALLEKAERLGLDLIAEQYNIILFMLEEDILQDKYLFSADRIRDEISGIFDSAEKTNERYITFSAGMGVTAFLVKAEDDKIMPYTQECIDILNEICRSADERIAWTAVAGEPVTRLSSVAGCYKKLRKKLFYNKSGQSAEFNENSLIDFNLNEMDASKLDSRVIEKFLLNGLQEDVDSFAEDWLEGFGSEAEKSVLFRQYIMLNMQFAVNAFLEKLGAGKTDSGEYRCGGTESAQRGGNELLSAANSPEDLKPYAVRLLSETLNLRDNTVTSKYQDMLANVTAYMKENFANPDMNLSMAAQITNVTPAHFSAVFSRRMGKTFVEYLTELRMEKARELLRNTSDNSSEIAYSVGYKDPHYFSSLFKKINGCSPRDYRGVRK